MSSNQQQQQSGFNHKAEDGAFNITPVDTYDPNTGIGEAGVAKNINLKPTGSGEQHGTVDGKYNLTNVEKFDPQTGKSVKP